MIIMCVPMQIISVIAKNMWIIQFLFQQSHGTINMLFFLKTQNFFFYFYMVIVAKKKPSYWTNHLLFHYIRNWFAWGKTHIYFYTYKNIKFGTCICIAGICNNKKPCVDPWKYFTSADQTDILN